MSIVIMPAMPRSTLFPYTTLFRSCERPAIATDLKFHDQLSDAAASGPRNIAEGFGRYYHPEFARFARIAKASEQEVLKDRKSTRLNSSHSQISYAVFCLKKKMRIH